MDKERLEKGRPEAAGPGPGGPEAPVPQPSGRGVALPLGLMLLSLAALYGVTTFVVSPNVERWIECRAAFPVLSGLLLVLHHGIGTAGFSAVWAAGLLILCWQVGGRKFGLMMAVNLLLCLLAAAEGLAALYLQAQRCGA
jgi:hypothetical protein